MKRKDKKALKAKMEAMIIEAIFTNVIDKLIEQEIKANIDIEKGKNSNEK